MAKIPSIPTSSIAMGNIDGAKAVTGAGKLAQNSDPAPGIEKANAMGGIISVIAGGVGFTTSRLSDAIKTTYANPLTVAKELKTSAGIIPNLLSMFAGAYKKDYVQVGLGGAGAFLATGMFRAIDHTMLLRFPNNPAMATLPAQAKAFIGVMAVLKGVYDINQAVMNPSNKKDGSLPGA